MLEAKEKGNLNEFIQIAIVILTCMLFAGCTQQHQQHQQEQEKYILHVEEGWQDCHAELQRAYAQLEQWQNIATELDSVLQLLIKEREETFIINH